MNIVFFGSAPFGIPSLKALSDRGALISCVVTQPDRKKGRGLALSCTSIKSLALDVGITVFQPEDINAASSIQFLKTFEADLFVVIAYGQILSPDLLALPKIMGLNVHASLLPHYRGAAPIQWAIINGDSLSGVSVMKLIKKMDAGPLLLQRMIPLAHDETAVTLENKLSTLGAQALSEALFQVEAAKFSLTPQDEQKVSYAPKLKKTDGLIAWERPAKDIVQLVRGCGVWPGAFTYYKGRILKVHKANLCLESLVLTGHVPGEIVEISKEGVSVASGSGIVRIEVLQMEAGEKLSVEEFIAGHQVQIKDILGNKSCA